MVLLRASLDRVHIFSENGNQYNKFPFSAFKIPPECPAAPEKLSNSLILEILFFLEAIIMIVIFSQLERINFMTVFTILPFRDFSDFDFFRVSLIRFRIFIFALSLFLFLIIQNRLFVEKSSFHIFALLICKLEKNVTTFSVFA